MKIVLVLALLAATGTAHAEAPAAPPPKLEDAIQRASAEGKPLLVEFYTDWCQPCKEFERTTLIDPKVQAALADVVWVRYDAEAEPGLAAATRYRIAAYPTFLAIDARGVERQRNSGALVGEHGVREFLTLISGAAPATLDEAVVRAKIRDKPNDPAIRLMAARWFADRGPAADAVANFEAVAASAKASAPQRAEAAAAGARLRRLEQWKRQLIAEKLALAREHPELVTAPDLAIVAIEAPAARDAIGKVLRAQSDPDQLNSLVYIAIAAGAYAEAEEAANRMVGDRKDAALLDTLAECHHARGDRTGALQIEDEAIALTPGGGPASSLKANRARFDAGTGVSDDVARVRGDVAAVWTALANIEKTTAPSPRPSGAAESIAMFSALRKLGAHAGVACARSAGNSPSAYARLTLGPDHRVKSAAVLVDADAPAALRTCVTNALVGAALPAVPSTIPAHVEISFKAEPAHP